MRPPFYIGRIVRQQLIWLLGTPLDAAVLQHVQQGRTVPVAFHRLSLSARTAAAIVTRLGRKPSGQRSFPFTRKGLTTVTCLSTSSTRRMLPSGCRSAENDLNGGNRSMHANRPRLSAVSFIMGSSHSARNWSSSLKRRGSCQASLEGPSTLKAVKSRAAGPHAAPRRAGRPIRHGFGGSPAPSPRARPARATRRAVNCKALREFRSLGAG